MDQQQRGHTGGSDHARTHAPHPPTAFSFQSAVGDGASTAVGPSTYYSASASPANSGGGSALAASAAALPGHSPDSDYIYSASASPQRLVRPILRKDLTPTHHGRVVSFGLPSDHQEGQPGERVVMARANGEIARAKASRATEPPGETINIPAPFAYPQAGAAPAAAPSASAPALLPLMSRQQKTAFHPLTTPAPASSRINPIHVSSAHTWAIPSMTTPSPSPPYASPTFPAHSSATDASTAVRMPMTASTPMPTMNSVGGEPPLPFVSQQYDYPLSNSALSTPDMSQPSSAAASLSHSHMVHALPTWQPHSNTAPRLSLTSMASPPGSSSGDELTPVHAAAAGQSFRDGSVLYTRGMANSSVPSAINRNGSSPRPLELPQRSPPSSGPPSPSKQQRPLSFSWSHAPSTNQSCTQSPWRFCTGYLMPHMLRVAKTRRPWRLLGVIAAFVLLCFLAPAFIPTVLKKIPRPDYSLHARSGVPDNTTAITKPEPSGGLYAWIGLDGPDLPVDDAADVDDASYSFSPLPAAALRECAPTDLLCRVVDVPLHTANGRTRRRLLLIVVNAGFAEMALNLICSSDMVGGASDGEAPGWTNGQIPRAAWLVACSDEESFEFFLARGIAAVRMNETSVLSDNVASATAEAARIRARTATEQPNLEAAIGAGAKAAPSIGTSASSWGESTHININREKVPLLLALLKLDLDVVLIDADVIFLRPLDALWDQPTHADTDLQIMYDYPSITTPAFGPHLSDCLVHPHTNTSAACRLVWEMNGGFFLLRSSPSTIALMTDMVAWLKVRPTEHDQDALRAALRVRAQEGRLAWRLDDGSQYPLAPAAASSAPPLTYRFLSNLLAPNGGLFFMEGRPSYLEASAREDILDPIAVHVNWVVGYARKEALMRQYGWWFVTRTRGIGGAAPGEHTLDVQREAQCINVILHARKNAAIRADSSDDSKALVRPPLNPHRIHGPNGVRSLTRPPYALSPSASLLLVTTAKPAAAFRSFPGHREADADGLGAYDPDAPEHDYPPEQRRAYLAEQAVQSRAQIMCFRNWYALTSNAHSASTRAPSPVNTAIFSDDPAHATLARHMRFDHFSEYDTDEYGMPLMHSLFRRAESLAKKKGIPSVMYTNGDLLYHDNELARTAATIQSYGFASYLAVGMRKNVESRLLDEQMSDLDREELARIQTLLESPTATDLSNDTSHALGIHASNARAFFSRLSLLSRPYRTDAMDYFIWSPGFFDWDVVPQFILGRIAYDNWIVHYGNSKVRADSSHGFGNSVVVDVSGTVDAIHIGHGSATLKPLSVPDAPDKMQQVLSTNSEIKSHFQPNSITNLRLGGQSSLKGLGKLDHVGWKTVRRASGEIQVVKVRPDGGHIAELFDVALEAHILVHERPTLLVVTVDTAHIAHLKNWLWSMRQALKNGGPRQRKQKDPADAAANALIVDRTGILVLSASAEVTTACKQLGVSVFELSPGDRSGAMLNGPAAANLQIAGLKARALVLLLEFGYDTLLCSISVIWKRNPFRVMAERAHIEGDTHEIQRRVRVRRQERVSAGSRVRNNVLGKHGVGEPAPASTSFDPVSSSDGLQMGGGLDLVAFAFDSSPFNVSSTCIFYRHTPATLKLWHRMLHEISALLQRAALPFQVNYLNLQLDWFIQHELHQNHVSTSAAGGLVWGSITMAAGVFMHPDLATASKRSPSALSTFPHLPCGSIRDADLLMANGWWFDRPGGLSVGFADDNQQRLRDASAWDEQSQRPPTTAVNALNSDDPCLSGDLDCGTLSSSELDLLLSVSSFDQSILVVPVVASAAPVAGLASSPLNLFLARAIEINFRHLILVCENTEIMHDALTIEHVQFGFATLYGSASTSSLARVPLLSQRLYQLVSRGFAVGLANFETSLLFGNPFELYTNREFEQGARERHAQAQSSNPRASRKQATRTFLASQGLWGSSMPASSPAMLRPLSDLSCDLHAHTATSSMPRASSHNNSLLLSGTSWTFISLQPTEQTRTLLGRLVQCNQRELNTASVGSRSPSSSLGGAGLHLECLQSASDALQSEGMLAVCEIDPDYFPSASSFFEPPSPVPVTPPSPSPADARVLSRGSGAPWRHVSESGVYPLVVPRRFENPVSGRVLEWALDWRARLAANLPPAVIKPPSSDRGASGSKHILCKQSASTPTHELPPNFLFRIRVLTFSRARSLKRLLTSLKNADFMGDSGKIRLEVSVDRPEGEVAPSGGQDKELAAAPSPNKETLSSTLDLEGGATAPPSTLPVAAQRGQVLSVLRDFQWPHGELSITLQPRHLGLVGQWLSGPLPSSDRDMTLVLEDDMELSPLFYSWLKGALCTYYFDATNFDARMFGISLQKQHYVLGQSAKNAKYQFMRFKEEKAQRDQWEARTKAAGGASASDPPPPTTDVAALFDIPVVLGDPLRHPVFKYQLLGTWGLLVFPQHWRAFHTWWSAKQTANAQLRTRGGSPEDLFEPCVPHLESSTWWAAKKTRVWSQWLIRYAFEQGWYCLYPHLPSNSALGVNHRESGENYGASRGARDTLLVSAPGVPSSLQPLLSLSSNLRFAFPPLASAPLFDYHLQRITVDPIVLQQRRAMHTERHMKRGCQAKDYKPFAQD